MADAQESAPKTNKEIKITMMKCICCGKNLENAHGISGVYDGVVWSSSGNYGSKLIDCSGSDYYVDQFILAICDDCVEKKADLILAVKDPNVKISLEIKGSLKDAIEYQKEIDHAAVDSTEKSSQK